MADPNEKVPEAVTAESIRASHIVEEAKQRKSFLDELAARKLEQASRYEKEKEEKEK
jgi:hypothetical protein